MDDLRDFITRGQNGPRWLTTVEVALLLGVRPQTLEKWRSQGKGPPFRKASRRVVRYDQTAVADWMASIGYGREN